MSIDPTSYPSSSSATITCMATVDLPDPPFSLPTTMIYGFALILSPDRTCAAISPGRSLSIYAVLTFILCGGPNPDRGVVEDRAAAGLARIGAGQCIDAEPAGKIRVGPDAFDHHHAALQPVEQSGMQRDGRLLVADLDHAALGDT